MSVDQPTLELITRLGIALAIGLLVGIERGWQERDMREGGRTAGIRTFSFIGLLGGASGALFQIAGPLPLAAALLAVTGAFTWFKFRETGEGKDYSVTSVVVAVLVFVLGTLAVVGEVQVAVSAGVVTVILLAARKSLHSWLRRLTWAELRSGLLLVAMTFLALPLLPDRPIDPWGAINPHELWLLTILIAAISAVGYIAVKVGGPSRGLIFGSLAGGIVSSTAATLASARRAREGGDPGLLATTTALSTLASYLRVYAIVMALAPAMWPLVTGALVPASLVIAGSAAIVWYRVKPKDEDGAEILGKFDNPVEIGFVLRFGVVLAVVFVLAKLAAKSFGDPSFLGLAALTGLVDVDPIVLTSTKLAAAGSLATASIGVLIAVTTNTIVKIGIGLIVGGRAFGIRLMSLLLGALIVGALGLGAMILLQS